MLPPNQRLTTPTTPNPATTTANAVKLFMDVPTAHVSPLQQMSRKAYVPNQLKSVPQRSPTLISRPCKQVNDYRLAAPHHSDQGMTQKLTCRPQPGYLRGDVKGLGYTGHPINGPLPPAVNSFSSVY